MKERKVSPIRETLVTVPSKLMLAGEYAVLVPGGKALAVACAPRMEVLCADSENDRVVLPDLGMSWIVTPGERLESLPHKALQLVARAMLEMRGRAPIRARKRAERGLALVLRRRRVPGVAGQMAVGASAALVAGAVKAMAHHLEFPVAPGKLLAPAIAAHGAAQGGGSGYDVATSLFGGAVLFRSPSDGAKSPKVLNKSALPAVHLVTASAGPSADTAGLLIRWREAMVPGEDGVLAPALAKAAADHVETSSALADSLWRWGWCRSTERLVAECVSTLEVLDSVAGLGAYTPRIRELLALAEAAGHPAKISGAGGGDLVVGFAPDRAGASRLQAVWRDASPQVVECLEG
jgi:phosphomevalonate kinase